MLFLLVGAHQVMQGQMSIGALVAFNALVALANAPIVTLMTLWDNLQHATVYLNRLDDIFQTGAGAGHRPLAAHPGQVARGTDQLPADGLPLRRRRVAADPRGHHLRHSAQHDGRHRRAERLGQDHAHQVPRRPARAHRGHHPLRRHRPQVAQLPRPPPEDRLRAAGESPLRRHHRAQHRLRRGGARSRRRDVGGPGGQRPRVHRAAAAGLRHPHRRVGPRRSPAASASASRSPAPSTTGRRCSSSTRPPARSTPSRSAP